MKHNHKRSFWHHVNKRVLLLCLALAAALLGVGIGVGAFLWAGDFQAVFFVRRGNSQGVVLVPESRKEVPDVVCYFRQKDPRWAGDRLGKARDTMASSGCLVCSLAAGLGMQGAGEMNQAAAQDMGLEGQTDGRGSRSQMSFQTAGELNRLFSEADVYTDSGAVIWDRIPDAVPGTVSYVAEGVDAGEIDRFLDQGIFPVVKVRVGGTGAFHWVLLVGADESSYLCMDPLAPEGREAPVSLEEFGNRVYAMRAVYYGDAGSIE